MATHIADKQAEERVATAAEYGLDVGQLDDQLSAYLRAAGKHRLLTADEEVALSSAIQAGIAAAKELKRIEGAAEIVDTQTQYMLIHAVQRGEEGHGYGAALVPSPEANQRHEIKHTDKELQHEPHGKPGRMRRGGFIDSNFQRQQIGHRHYCRQCPKCQQYCYQEGCHAAQHQQP